MNNNESLVVPDHPWEGVANLSGHPRHYSTMTGYASL